MPRTAAPPARSPRGFVLGSVLPFTVPRTPPAAMPFPRGRRSNPQAEVAGEVCAEPPVLGRQVTQSVLGPTARGIVRRCVFSGKPPSSAKHVSYRNRGPRPSGVRGVVLTLAVWDTLSFSCLSMFSSFFFNAGRHLLHRTHNPLVIRATVSPSPVRKLASHRGYEAESADTLGVTNR